MADIERISPERARQHVAMNAALLVCAYEAVLLPPILCKLTAVEWSEGVFIFSPEKRHKPYCLGIAADRSPQCSISKGSAGVCAEFPRLPFSLEE